MNKEYVLKKLDDFNIDRNLYVVIDDAALVILDMIDTCKNITICVSEDLYGSLDYMEVNEYKMFDDIVIVKGQFDYMMIDNYKCMNYKELYDRKELLKLKKSLVNKLNFLVRACDNLSYEKELRQKGIKLIAGVDEVGRGPLVGDVVTACVVLPEEFNLDGLTDSKKMSESKRLYFYDKIKSVALGVGVGRCSPSEIDKYNIYEATKIAMKRAIDDCLKSTNIEHVLIDAMELDIDIPKTSIVKGDILSISISAASVIAKVERDRDMILLDKKYPMYNFKNNKGYPTKDHLNAILDYGIIDEHRKSYGPVKDYCVLKNIDIS